MAASLESEWGVMGRASPSPSTVPSLNSTPPLTVAPTPDSYDQCGVFRQRATKHRMF